MKKVAKLITVEFTTRVVVNEGDDDFTVFKKAQNTFVNAVKLGSLSDVSEIKNDTECPYPFSDEEKSEL